MHKYGWRPFWAALGAALLVLLPLVGGTVLLTRQMVRTRIQTAQPQSGVPIQLPRAEHRMTLLLCTAGEQPGFLLVYLNAAQNSLNLLAVPGELTVPFNGETASLAHCYGAAGPARCRQALLEMLGLPEDEDIDSNTVNGLVQEKTCRLPKVGDRFTLGSYDGVVTRTAKRRVTEVRLTPAEKPETKKDEEEKGHFGRMTSK